MIGFFYAIAIIGAGAFVLLNLEPLIVTGTSLLLGQVLLPLQFVGVLVVVSALIFYARADTRNTSKPCD